MSEIVKLFAKGCTAGMLKLCPDYTKYHKPKRTKRKKAERTNYDLTPSQQAFRDILNDLFSKGTFGSAGRTFTDSFRARKLK